MTKHKHVTIALRLYVIELIDPKRLETFTCVPSWLALFMSLSSLFTFVLAEKQWMKDPLMVSQELWLHPCHSSVAVLHNLS